MRLEQLQYLIAISHYPSISTAADKMHISHQAMSAAIKALESELNAQLIERRFSGVSLTADGRYLVKIAQEFCQKLQHFQSPARAADMAVHGRLHIVSSQMALEGLLPKIIANFYTQYPFVQVSTASLKPQAVVNRYEDGQADLAFLAFYSLDDQPDFVLKPGLAFVPCLSLTPCIEVSKADPLAAKRFVALKQLRQQCIVYNCPEQMAQDDYNRWPFAYVKSQKTIFEPSRSIYTELLRNGCGIGISMLFKSRPLTNGTNDLTYVPLQTDGDYYLGYLRKEGAVFTEIAALFLNYLQDYYSPYEELN